MGLWNLCGYSHFVAGKLRQGDGNTCARVRGGTPGLLSQEA